MWTIPVLIVGLECALSALPGGQEATDDGPDKPLAAAVAAHNRFAIETYLRACPGRENLILSPLSIRSALDLVLEGTAGATREELEAVLYPGLAEPPDRAVLGRLGKMLVDDGASHGELRLASALWSQAGAGIRPAFLSGRVERLDASVETVDFHGDPDAACARMNEWTREQTGGLIGGKWNRGRIHPLLDLVLANAFYFRADWESVFGSSPGRGQPFWIDTRKRVAVTMMSRQADLRHYSDPRLEAVVIPYRGAAFSMIVLLPRDMEAGLTAMEQKLSAGYLARILTGAKKRAMKLILPRFEVRSQVDVAGILSDDGPPLAFQRGRADLSALTSDENAFIGAMEHGALIQVNERGTKVAAETRVVIYRGPPPPPTPEMRVDHPFLYAICHEPTGAILVIGRLAHPKGEPLPDLTPPVHRTRQRK